MALRGHFKVNYAKDMTQYQFHIMLIDFHIEYTFLVIVNLNLIQLHQIILGFFLLVSPLSKFCICSIR